MAAFYQLQKARLLGDLRIGDPRRKSAIALLSVVFIMVGCLTSHNEKNIQLSTTHSQLGADYLKKKMPLAAKRELLKALELDEANHEAHHLLGCIFFLEAVQEVNYVERNNCLNGIEAEEGIEEANKDFQKSKHHFNLAVQIYAKKDRVDSESLNYLANIALHFKQYDDAISFAKKALSNIVYASRHLALGNLGWAYYLKEDFKHAERELRQAIFQEPKFCIGRYRLAKVYYDQGKYEKAFEELKTLEAETECPIQEINVLLGMIYLKKRDIESAKRQFDLCIKIHPKSCIADECRRYLKLT